MYNKLFKIGCLTALIILLAAMPTWALTFDFNNITNNDSGDAAIGESQLSVEVKAVGLDQVSFKFLNTAPDNPQLSFIRAVYFDDDSGFFDETVAPTINESDGVAFKETKKLKNLPGGKDSGFTADYSYEAAKPGTNKDGVDQGVGSEYVMITFDLLDGLSFDDIIAALQKGDLTIGVKVQGFESGGSEGFTTGPPVPEPATLLLFGTGLVCLAGLGRKKLLKK